VSSCRVQLASRGVIALWSRSLEVSKLLSPELPNDPRFAVGQPLTFVMLTDVWGMVPGGRPV
jgi:hypothetical protein